ncbi:DUF3558 domain-containing protein [Pseudonocardia acidicola]|uniref:DUF3558 family protein n=1 Tax=Pseudonocardia acidicola TaxID=2724939 RepID=A0ABX1SL21_9PSEU|nr:DUF3558 domain-containing protein [Pseudonocardia acidicola]NMI02252.1 DUF3558 family protein [Pseudonocardia acidicola]
MSLVAATGVLVLAGCASSSTAAPAPSTITLDPLDAAPYVGKPCDLLRTDHVAQLQLVAPGTPEPGAGGPVCRWASTRPGRPSFTAGVDPGHGLADLYRQRAEHPYFSPTTIAGYPAVDTGEAPAAQDGRCAVEVGVADHSLIIVGAGPGATSSPAPPDPCLEANRVATAIVGQLNAGSP